MTHLEIIGRVWSDWSIIEKLGEGSFGQVFRARKERFGVTQEAAIKVVRIPGDDVELKRVQSGYGLNEQELKEYFYPEVEKLKKEIVLMQELGEDSHIVRILDFEIIDAPDAIVGWYILIRMELLECLENYIKRADITVADVVAVGEDVLTSLEVCEERNIIHRDIKPANLFRSDKGVYKLGDFGIARDMRAGMGSLSHKGTENYMAPEVYLGKKYTSNIDIYALGIVLYKLLNKNRLPFMNEEKLTAGSVERAFQKRNTGEKLPKPVESPDTLYEIIKKMCAYNPNERFQTAFEVKKALSEYRQNHKEELKSLLNVARKTESIQNQFKHPVNEVVFEQVKNDSKVNDNKSNISSAQSDKKYSGTKDIKDIEPELSKSNNNENKAEGYKDGGTKSIYEASRQSQAKVAVQPIKEQASREQTVIERVEQAPKKRSKVGLILGIGAGVLVLFVGTFIFIGSNVKEEEYVVAETSETTKKKNKETEAETKTKEEITYEEETAASEEENSVENDTLKEGAEAIAKEIADDDSIFEIDTDKYAEYSMEYTTILAITDEPEEVKGIYIGKIESGKPNGYGLFYYTNEVKSDIGKPSCYSICSGEWEDGNLKSGENVKKRFLNYLTSSERYYYIISGKWNNVDFEGNVEGKSVDEGFNSSTGKWEYEIWREGVLKKELFYYELVSGKIYFGMTGSVYEGEFDDTGDLYNGTVYGEDGNVKWTVVNGEHQ